jgi:glycerophosphoryl diester phosphodiesterase
VLILGHRGASKDAPENTVEAFQLAISQGADGVELDAMLAGSGEVVVCHDDRLDRLAGVSWRVSQTPWSKLRQLDVGSRLGFAPARIPLLAEVLESLGSEALINIELKCETLRDHGLVKAVARALRAEDADRVLLSSFNGGCLLRVKYLRPDLRRGYLLDVDRSFGLHGVLLPRLMANHSVHPHHSLCTEEHIGHWSRAGFKVAAWTVDSPAEADGLARLGIHYCITNCPAALRAGSQRTSKTQANR